MNATEVFPKPIRQNVFATNLPVVLMTLCTLGLGLRLLSLTAESFWLDEATSLIIARMPLDELGQYLLKDDVHPPLYFLLLHFWVAGGEGVAYLRLFSVLTGVLTIIATYLLGKQLFDRTTGLIAAAVVAISPLHIFYSQMVRNYSLFILFTVLSFYALLRATDNNHWRWWSFYSVCAVASLYTHYFSIFALFFQNGLVFFFYFRHRPLKAWRSWILASALVSTLFLLWLLNSAMLEGKTPGWLLAQPVPGVTKLTETLINFSFGIGVGNLYPRWLRLEIYPLFLGVLFIALFQVKTTRPFVVLRNRTGAFICLGYLALPIITIWLISHVKMMYATRYLLPFMIPFYLLLAAGILEVKNHKVRGTVLALVIASILPGLWFTYQKTQLNDWRMASAYILEQAQPDDGIAFSPSFYWKPFDYYSRDAVSILDTSAPDQLCDSILKNHRRIWFVQVQETVNAEDAVMTRRLTSCLDANFKLLTTLPIPPEEGAIYLYGLRNS